MNFDRILSPERLGRIREKSRLLMEHDSLRLYNYIYRRYVSNSFDPLAGTASNTWVEIPIDAVRGTFTAEEKLVGQETQTTRVGAKLAVGDYWLMFDPKRLNFQLNPNDRVLEEITSHGTITISSGSANVLGLATQFIEDGVLGGDILRIDSTDYSIKTVSADNGNAALVLTTNVASNIDAKSFVIYREYEIVDRLVDPIEASARISIRRAGV